MTKPIPESLAEMKKGLVCLVPREDSDSVITCHEKTLCDCQVLKLIEVVEVLTKATPLKHLDNGSISANECLCLIRRDTENALTQAAKILEKKV